MKSMPAESENKFSLERAALLLALSETRQEENSLKEHYTVHEKITCGVTETGGTVAALQHTGKLTNSVLSTGLNTGVIRKDAKQIHALVHAALEASNSIFIHTHGNASFALKIGLTTDGDWLAVAIFGRSSLHPLSEHCRVGLGYMHL
ncbi:anti-terminator HutP [Peptococcaceae bacterium CEB3]|nr:anti-terminator HutP [Peptococcaceae bacterium CEB3]